MTINYQCELGALTQANIRTAVRNLLPHGPHKMETIAYLHGQILSLRSETHYARGPELLLYFRGAEDKNTTAVDGVQAPVGGDMGELNAAVCAMFARFLRSHARQWCMAADRLDPLP